MPEETLNIDYHTRRLILLALNKYKQQLPAAAALGISERWLRELRARYGVVQNENGEWIANEIELSSMRPLQSVA